MASVSRVLNLQFVDETGNVESEEFDRPVPGRKRRPDWQAGLGDDDSDSEDCTVEAVEKPRPGKKTRGRVKIRMAYISDKVRRYTTFSKRKTGIMKKAYELAVLTGTQVMLLVASETGHVYTFATRKLQPVIMSENGKALIQTCLNSPDAPPSPHVKDTSASSQTSDERMNPLGFEEPNLMYAGVEERTNQPTIKHGAKSDETLKSDGSVRLTGLPVLGSPLEPSPGVSQTAASSTQPVKLVHQPVTVGTYFAALKDPGVAASSPESAKTIAPSTASKNDTSQCQHLYYRLEGSNQVISIPIDSCTKLVNTSDELKLKSASMTSQPLTVINGGATSGNMLMYQSPQAVVLPVQNPSTSRTILNEGYVLNIANAPNLAVAPDTLGGNSQQLFTLPFTVTSSQISQPDSSASRSVHPFAGFANGQKKSGSQRK